MSIPGIQALHTEHSGAGPNRDAATTAGEVVRHFKVTDAALSPVVGHRAVVALYERTLHLASRLHPWLPGSLPEGQSEIDLEALAALVARQGDADAAAAAASLTKLFHDLLASLIGASLTEQLLRVPRSVKSVQDDPR